MKKDTQSMRLDLPRDLHKIIKIHCIQNDITMLDFATKLFREELFPEGKPAIPHLNFLGRIF